MRDSSSKTGPVLAETENYQWKQSCNIGTISNLNSGYVEAASVADHALLCRWLNHLDPSVSHSEWSEQENIVLIKMQAQLGNHWSKFREFLPGRPDNSIKNQWHTVLKPLLEGHARQQVLKGASQAEADLIARRAAVEALACQWSESQQAVQPSEPQSTSLHVLAAPVRAQMPISAPQLAVSVPLLPRLHTIKCQDWSPDINSAERNAPASSAPEAAHPAPQEGSLQPKAAAAHVSLPSELLALPSAALPIVWQPPATLPQRPAHDRANMAPAFMPYRAPPTGPMVSAPESIQVPHSQTAK